VILLAESLARLSWSLLLPPVIQSSPPPVVASPDTPATASDKTGEYATIAGWHLFGKTDAPKPVAPPPPAKVQETKLNLRLVGVYASENTGVALAFIAEGNGPERTFRIGEVIGGSSRVDQINSDHVVLVRNGVQEILSLPKDPGKNRPAGAPPAPAAPIPPAFAPGEPSGVEEPPPVQAEPPPQENAPPDQLVDATEVAQRLRAEAVNQPDSLQKLAVASPYMEGGKFVGFRLRPGRDAQLFRKLGLAAGDVITQVNGTPLTDPSQGFQLLQGLLNAPQISVVIKRGQNELPYTFILNDD
jgi:general secretion pathway protein C